MIVRQSWSTTVKALTCSWSWAGLGFCVRDEKRVNNPICCPNRGRLCMAYDTTYRFIKGRKVNCPDSKQHWYTKEQSIPLLKKAKNPLLIDISFPSFGKHIKVLSFFAQLPSRDLGKVTTQWKWQYRWFGHQDGGSLFKTSKEVGKRNALMEEKEPTNISIFFVSLIR